MIVFGGLIPLAYCKQFAFNQLLMSSNNDFVILNINWGDDKIHIQAPSQGYTKIGSGQYNIESKWAYKMAQLLYSFFIFIFIFGVKAKAIFTDWVAFCISVVNWQV